MKHRFVFFLCILLLGEEFSKAKSAIEQLKHNNDIGFDDDFYGDFESQVHGSLSVDDGAETSERFSIFGKEETDSHSKIMHLVRQKPVDECAGKKGWITTGFKIFKIFGQVSAYSTLVVQLGTEVYSAIRKCKDIAPDAEGLVNSYKEERKNAERLSQEADDLQIASLQERNFIEATTMLYRKILCKLNEIDKDSDNMLLSISPEVSLATENATRQIEKLVQEKNDTLEGITYLEVDKLYRSSLQHGLGIAIPAILLALPASFALFKMARKRYRQRKVADIEVNSNVDLKLPSKSKLPKLFRSTKFSKWIGRVQARFQDRIKGLKDKFNKFFGRIGKTVGRAFNGLASVASIASSAYFAYKAIASLHHECRTLRAKAQEAYDKSIEAVKIINETLVDIKSYRKEMAQSWSEMRAELTKDEFLKSVQETMVTMQNAANQSEPMKAVARGIGQFLDKIKTTNHTNETYSASHDLYNTLIKVPFAYVCYTNKINIINYVVKKCKEGTKTLKQIIAEQKLLFGEYDSGDDNDPRRCKDDLGIDYLPDHSIVQTWMGTAQENGYHPICYMNDEITREKICDKSRMFGWDASQIASKRHLDEDKVQEIIDLLPELAMPSLMQDRVCKARQGNPPMSFEQIRSTFVDRLDINVSIEQIKAVQCNGTRKYLCVPYEQTVKEAWDENPIKLPEIPDE